MQSQAFLRVVQNVCRERAPLMKGIQSHIMPRTKIIEISKGLRKNKICDLK
jgi:hypothetical protein